MIGVNRKLKIFDSSRTYPVCKLTKKAGGRATNKKENTHFPGEYRVLRCFTVNVRDTFIVRVDGAS